MVTKFFFFKHTEKVRFTSTLEILQWKRLMGGSPLWLIRLFMYGISGNDSRVIKYEPTPVGIVKCDSMCLCVSICMYVCRYAVKCNSMCLCVSIDMYVCMYAVKCNSMCLCVSIVMNVCMQ